jgi:hypothetical protein
VSSPPAPLVVPPDVERIFRVAVACRECFVGSKLRPALVDIAQPRPIGTNYWTSDLKIVLVLVNRAAGKVIHDAANGRFARRIHSYAQNGPGALSPVFEHQITEMPDWGDGKFRKFRSASPPTQNNRIRLHRLVCRDVRPL